MSSGQSPLPTDDHPPPAPSRRTLRQRLLLGGGIGIVLVVLVVVAGVGYLWYRYNQIGREDVSLDEALANEPQNFLIVGSDTRDVIDESDPDATAFLGEEPGGRRSDTIMVARVDAQNRTVDLVSFPRDLWVPIVGTGSSERINTAYGASDGPQRLIDTIRQDFDIEIIEKHHRFKKDSPSGTALHFGRIVQQAMGQSTLRHGREGLVGERPADEIGIHAIRVGDNVGEHTILFSTLGETLELTHRAHTRDCYARGALQAAKFLANRPAGRYTMKDVLGLPT